MALIKGIHHVSLNCDSSASYEETVRFYQQVLEMPVIRQWQGGTMLDTGCGIVEIFCNAASSLSQGAVRHFALSTDDVDGCVLAVKNAGYRVTVEPKDVVIGGEPPMPVRIAFCIGPVGEEIEFFHVK